jgi:hypothetical protein
LTEAIWPRGRTTRRHVPEVLMFLLVRWVRSRMRLHNAQELERDVVGGVNGPGR